jgi:hypothetical protein
MYSGVSAILPVFDWTIFVFIFTKNVPPAFQVFLERFIKIHTFKKKIQPLTNKRQTKTNK